MLERLRVLKPLTRILYSAGVDLNLENRLDVTNYYLKIDLKDEDLLLFQAESEQINNCEYIHKNININILAFFMMSEKDTRDLEK
jgi:hypothetical protein